jgi:hypothetical protein
MKGELEKAELRFTLSVTTSLFWAICQADGDYVAKNGSAFFINTGERLFGVTAHHVVEEWRRDRSQQIFLHLYRSSRSDSLGSSPPKAPPSPLAL